MAFAGKNGQGDNRCPATGSEVDLSFQLKDGTGMWGSCTSFPLHPASTLRGNTPLFRVLAA